MQSILVTGANGFIGQHIIKQLLDKRNYKVIACGKDSRLPFHVSEFLEYVPFDITDHDQVMTNIQLHAPQVVIHAAAISQPDQCEMYKEECDNVNIDGTSNITAACAEMDAHLFFLSTDFVFSGKDGPYREDDEREPVNHYGWSKVRGEEILEQSGISYCIGRLCFVYGLPVSGESNNLVSRVKKILENREVFNVVTDQIRTPTWNEDAASAIIKLCEQRKNGIYHISGVETMSPYDMAIRIADHLKLDVELLKRVKSADFVQPALRPLHTGFDTEKLRSAIDFQPHGFGSAVNRMFPG